MLSLLLAGQPVWGQTNGQSGPPFAEDEIVVKFKPGAAARGAAGGLALAAIGAVVQASPELDKIGVQVFKVPRGTVSQALAALQQNPQIEFAEPNYLVEASDVITPNDTYWSQQWGPPDIQAPLAWGVTTGTAAVTIAVIDSGIDFTHTELAPNVWTNPGEVGLDGNNQDKRTNGVDDDGDGYIDDWRGWNFVAGSNNPQDDQGHGTHVAGIAAAVGNNGQGIAGMAWNTQIMALKILNSAGNGTVSNLASAMVFAADHGAQIINLSLGDTVPATVMEDAVNYAYAHGVTVVAAAGNDYHLGVRYPAAYPNAIAVASVDSNNSHSSFSNYGPEIDVAAPGRGILSTCLGGGYCSKAGTSMATPHVAGVAALLASLPQFNTPDKIRAALQNTALDLGTLGWDPDYGYGLVQAHDALRYGYHVAIVPQTTFEFALAGSVKTYPLTLSNTGVVADSYTVTLSSGVNFSATVTPDLINGLEPGAAVPVTITVTVPGSSPKGASQIDTLTVTSQGDSQVQAMATITTVVPYTYLLFPIFH
jgi:thermitase